MYLLEVGSIERRNGIWIHGDCRITNNRIVLSPTRTTLLRRKKGIVIQIWKTATPQSPVKRKMGNSDVVLHWVLIVFRGNTLHICLMP
jgi:hypothetical protein